MPLQRRITDFGADDSFEKASEKIVEHYGVTVPISSVRAITLQHSELIKEMECLQDEIPEQSAVECLIAELDGSNIPIVDTNDISEAGESIDKRKTRKVRWKEARLTLVHPKGVVDPIFGSTLGSPEDTGDHLVHCAIRAGIGQKTKVHGVSDGAPWIADQVDRVFGEQAGFLVDFYHLCDYLAAASKTCSPEDPLSWLNEKKQEMKESRVSEVLDSLHPYIETSEVPDGEAPVRRCHKYITNRPGQFDYKSALEADLPIGSGEIESAHRYVIQERLKIAGAWWKEDNAEKMLSLRTLRANNDWEDYWTQVFKKAA